MHACGSWAYLLQRLKGIDFGVALQVWLGDFQPEPPCSRAIGNSVVLPKGPRPSPTATGTRLRLVPEPARAGCQYTRGAQNAKARRQNKLELRTSFSSGAICNGSSAASGKGTSARRTTDAGCLRRQDGHRPAGGPAPVSATNSRGGLAPLPNILAVGISSNWFFSSCSYSVPHDSFSMEAAGSNLWLL